MRLRRNPIDRVEIVEPPLGDLSKKTHTWRRSCFTGVLSIVIFIALLWGAARLYLGPSPKILTSVPGNFPGEVPLYDQDNIERVTYITGLYKARGLALTAFLPKLALSARFYNLNGEAEQAGFATRQYQNFKKVFGILADSGGAKQDVVRIEWNHLDAEPQFIASYYLNQLKNSGYNYSQIISEPGEKQITFSNGQHDIELYVRGDVANRPGTDYAVLTVTVDKP